MTTGATFLPVTKHHALGNDFLVVNAPVPDGLDWPGLARRWCDRRRGIGADGVMLVTPERDWVGYGAFGIAHVAPVEVRMRLWNADGSSAEMSGNGIRCLAQAVAMARNERTGTYRVLTAAGPRTVDVRTGLDPQTCSVTVSMGPVMRGVAPARWAAVAADDRRPVAHLSLGNPHTVVLTDDVWSVDLAAVGALVPDTNLEVVEVADGGAVLVMRVHERGAGVTEACGSGACATAYAVRSWGMSGDEVRVRMPGGEVQVRLHGDEAVLTGPATFIATCTLPVDRVRDFV